MADTSSVSATSNAGPGQPPKLQNIILIGSGGVGTIAALVLSKSGRARVTTVLRSKYEIVKTQGWDIDSVDHGVIKGWRSDHIVQTIDDAIYSGPEPATGVESGQKESLRKQKYDFVVLCTKQLPGLSPTPSQLAPLITPQHTTIVLIQNGVFIEQPFISAFPQTPILSAVSMIGSFVLPPNRISHIGHDILQIGAHYHSGCPDNISTARLHEFVAMYRDGGAADCTIALDMAKARWAKLLWNGSFNTLCALLLLNVGQIQRSAGAKVMVLGIMREIAAVAAKDGCILEEEMLQHMASRSPESSTWRPSMLLDREEGRPMEIEVILGNALRKGLELGVPCPIMISVYDLLKMVDGVIQESGKTG